MNYAEYLRDNPVIVLDLIKYLIAALALFLPVPLAVAVPVAGAVLLVLTVITRGKVTPNHKVPTGAPEGLPADADQTVTLPAVQ